MAPRQATRGAWILLVATGIAAVMMFAYPTVTHRYRTDIWPLVAALAILMLPGLVRVHATAPLRADLLRAGVSVGFVIALFFAYVTVPIARFSLVENRLYFVWAQPLCERLAQERGFEQQMTQRMCAL